MGKRLAIALIAIGLITATLTTHLLGEDHQSGAAAGHLMLTPSEVKWTPFPALGPGVEIAILTGDPFKTGSPFVFRVELPNRAKVPPHWHPVDEHVTVISGTFLLGPGGKFDTNVMRELPAGSYAFMPKHARHFAFAKGDTIIQLDGVGPFKIIYVNPADDPSRQIASPQKNGL